MPSSLSTAFIKSSSTPEWVYLRCKDEGPSASPLLRALQFTCSVRLPLRHRQQSDAESKEEKQRWTLQWHPGQGFDPCWKFFTLNAKNVKKREKRNWSSSRVYMSSARRVSDKPSTTQSPRPIFRRGPSRPSTRTPGVSSVQCVAGRCISLTNQVGRKESLVKLNPVAFRQPPCSPPPPPPHSLSLFLFVSLCLCLCLCLSLSVFVSVSVSLCFSLSLSLSPSLCHFLSRCLLLPPPPSSLPSCLVFRKRKKVRNG